MGPQSNQNNFFGIKVSKPGINVNSASPSQLIYQNDYSSETFYGIQYEALKLGNIGSKGTNQYGMDVYNGSGTNILTLGEYSTGAYGMNVLNGSGSTMLEAGLLPSGSYGINLYDGTSQYSQSGVPQILIGLLPDGTVGIVQSISGVNVNNIFT